MIMLTLRTATRPWHDRIEADLALLREDFTLDDYRRYLMQAHGYYKAWEQRVWAWQGSHHADLPLHRRLPLIERDLAFWGIPQHDINALPVCADLPALQTLEQIIGSAYVIEGASLGGLIITKRLQRRFGDGGYDFLAGAGKETAAQWQAFGQRANELITPAMEDAAVASACATFDSMHRWFCGKERKQAC